LVFLIAGKGFVLDPDGAAAPEHDQKIQSPRVCTAMFSDNRGVRIYDHV